MTHTHMVYLAGPDVFFRNASEVMRRKAEIAGEYGFLASSLAEDALNPAGMTARDFGLAIGRANEAMMDRSDFIIANLTPFRGISADIGTAFEVGYMRAQGKPVFGYSNDGRDYHTRLTSDYYAGDPLERVEGVTRGRDGLMIEDHGMADNLMLDTAIAESGGNLVARDGGDVDRLGDLAAFREVLVRARAFFDAL